jgi:hypothetical protein
MKVADIRVCALQSLIPPRIALSSWIESNIRLREGGPTLADKAAKKALELDPSARVSLLALQIPLRPLGGP